MSSQGSRERGNLNMAGIESFADFPRASQLRGFYFGYYFFAVEHTRLRAAGDET